MLDAAQLFSKKRVQTLYHNYLCARRPPSIPPPRDWLTSLDLRCPSSTRCACPLLSHVLASYTWISSDKTIVTPLVTDFDMAFTSPTELQDLINQLSNVAKDYDTSSDVNGIKSRVAIAEKAKKLVRAVMDPSDMGMHHLVNVSGLFYSSSDGPYRNWNPDSRGSFR